MWSEGRRELGPAIPEACALYMCLLSCSCRMRLPSLCLLEIRSWCPCLNGLWPPNEACKAAAKHPTPRHQQATDRAAIDEPTTRHVEELLHIHMHACTCCQDTAIHWISTGHNWINLSRVRWRRWHGSYLSPTKVGISEEYGIRGYGVGSESCILHVKFLDDGWLI